ncbi:probable ubiquitin-conjugating enzyme E2 23 isoform X1 [Selaginella moellendorffii]|uniref:probable ubiquitin-conjugating enzyme E2 23 isoform X1 n=1 Tax=Selaginella moellendorffii TaxID=88036 RepID=UPI000D1C3E47|nr:probable ubiquitin-conjugating enzyme E2 23 isoform X1 [Selaginella moellendorffii]|eukprot:XP_024518990.1 probable ubiquitin-conjugating enzyme E2 23 isoform X1 [Selaginella moellendorffii]
MEEDEQQQQGQQQDDRFFERDVVGSIANPDRVGIIDEIGGAPSTSGSEDDEECGQDVEEGAAIIVWNDGEEETVDLSEVRLVDRVLDRGELVALAGDPLDQFGVVQSVELLADLRLRNGEVMKSVSSSKLRQVCPFMQGDYVVRGNWIGRVDEVEENVTVLFEDGAKCKVFRADNYTLVPAEAAEWSCDYYVGMRVRPAKNVVFKTARWLRGGWKSSRDEGTVCRVDVAALLVYWMGVGVGPVTPTPADYQDVKDVIHLPHFSHSREHWRIGDHTLPPKDVTVGGEVAPKESNDGREVSSTAVSTSSDAVSSNPEPSLAEEALHESSPLQRKRSLSRRCTVRRKAKRKLVPLEIPVRVTRTERLVDVLWQDGSKSARIPATSLVPVLYLNDSDFWPETYVIERGAEAEMDDDKGYRRVGIVKTIDATQRTARVKWFKRVTSPDEACEFEAEETVGVYDILEHVDYRYNIGDIVIRLTPQVPKADDSTEKVEQPQAPDDEGKHANDPTDLSWVGSIVGLEDGYIMVEWGSGDVTKVGPHGIFVVDRNESGDDESSSDDDDDDADSWETVDSNSLSDFESTPVPAEQPVTREETQGGLLTFVLSSMSRLISTIMGLRAKKVVAVGEQEDIEEPDELVCEMLLVRKSPADRHFDQNTNDHSTECSVRPLTEFKSFDMVKDASDHHFADVKNEVPNQRKWLKRVNQEWDILQKDLPDTIFVLMYEDRMDLLRAAIVGATGTPYHDGFFVFDLYLPPDYPNVPPMVHYHSGGLRMNPNLYENGKVCLSLLNTWSGRGSELWNPGTSNILQVLVSIQGLVLNAKPYFNEAGYDNQTGTGEGEKNSIAYNENTFLLSCKTILYLLRNPPMHFEELLKSHFRYRGFKFLSLCRAYLGGLPVGRNPADSSEGSPEKQEESSAGFQLILRKLVPKLAAAFVKIGATECREFEEPPSS